jgi:UTP--glucose-1-phosphate uridylyltransferase
MSSDQVTAAVAKMRAAGQHEDAIASFVSALTRVQAGASPTIASSELEPAPDVPALDELPPANGAALAHVVIIKLNGGLATSMGLQQPKSLLEARDGHSFLEIIIGQTLAARQRYGVTLPVVLMNSEATREATLAALAAHPELKTDGLDLAFDQSMVPKLDAETLMPASWPQAPHLEWNPPGHGDVYSSLRGSGMLASLLERGFRYAMISNADNLGSIPDPRIAAHVAREQIPFLMEAVIGTAADRKGGHIAKLRADGRLVLRETAQTPAEDADSFTDYRRWRYYNTNSLWIDLEALEQRLGTDGGLELPVIVNSKTVDPRDKDSTPVVQLESAMGAAIGSFPGARVLVVPRTRFAPVKTNDDLLVLRSDVYELEDDFAIQPVPEHAETPPFVALDKHYYKLIDQFEERFPAPVSLRQADSLVVKGDVHFGSGVVIQGKVELEAREGEVLNIPSGVRLSGKYVNVVDESAESGDAAGTETASGS